MVRPHNFLLSSFSYLTYVHTMVILDGSPPRLFAPSSPPELFVPMTVRFHGSPPQLFAPKMVRPHDFLLSSVFYLTSVHTMVILDGSPPRLFAPSSPPELFVPMTVRFHGSPPQLFAPKMVRPHDFLLSSVFYLTSVHTMVILDGSPP